MNTDFVPLSSLLESMKAPSFEGLDSDVSVPEPVKESVAQASQNPTNKETEVHQSEIKDPPNTPEPVEEKVCSEPKVLLDRDGDKITQIRVLCSCGQSIVLDCQYPN